eukprot:g1859.t1
MFHQSRVLRRLLPSASSDVTPSIVSSFKRDGFVQLPNPILSIETVEKLKSRFAPVFRGEFDTSLFPDEWHWREGISKDTATREICNAWKSDRCIASTVLCKELGELGCALMGWSSARVGQDDIIWKPPGAGPVGHHIDGTYISNHFVPLENNSITVWIALDDADESTGVVEYVPGSHKWEKSNNLTIGGFHGDVGNDHRAPSKNAAKSANISNYEVISCVVPKGHCVIHSQDVWHGSGPNKSEKRIRRALVVHLIRGDVQFNDREVLLGESQAAGYIYGRYKLIGSTELKDEFFPTTFPAARRSHWIEQFCQQ